MRPKITVGIAWIVRRLWMGHRERESLMLNRRWCWF